MAIFVKMKIPIRHRTEGVGRRFEIEKHMRKFVILIGLVVMHLSAVAQQSIHSRKMDAFRTIDLAGNLHVELIRSDTIGVDILLNNTTIERLQWGVKDGVLSIYLKPGGQSEANGEVKLYYQDFDNLKISQSSVVACDTLNRLMLDVQLQAGATFSGTMDVKDLNLKVTGNSAAHLSGVVKYLTLGASGKSKVDARRLEAIDASVSAASTAEVYVWSQERLQVSAESGGAVYYKGAPEIFRSSTKMMGTVNNIGQ